MREQLQRLWEAACEYDGVPLNAQFVAFSTDNPHAQEYNDLLLGILEPEEEPDDD